MDLIMKKNIVKMIYLNITHFSKTKNFLKKMKILYFKDRILLKNLKDLNLIY